ncbi:hypothetical protein SDC9_130238 [bioreactor metagenome]|uniref:Uncharacterized protein n=1 Tax=bioreactor metagenome TaxID=1076179 RepID=A0A645D1X3_9ZZZZ
MFESAFNQILRQPFIAVTVINPLAENITMAAQNIRINPQENSLLTFGIINQRDNEKFEIVTVLIIKTHPGRKINVRLCHKPGFLHQQNSSAYQSIVIFNTGQGIMIAFFIS